MQSKCHNDTCDNFNSIRLYNNFVYCTSCISYHKRNGIFPKRKRCLGCSALLHQMTADRSDHCSDCTLRLELDCIVGSCLGKRTKGSGYYCFSHNRDFVSGQPFRVINYHGKKGKCFKHGNNKPCYPCERNAFLVKSYGITYDQYLLMVDSQHNKCAFPDCTTDLSEKVLFVDHNHETGEVKALLCYRHNFLLGLAHDDILQLQHAIDYLNRFSQKQGITTAAEEG